MMMDRLFIVRLQSYFQHAKRFILVDDLVMLWRRSDGIERRIPG